MKPTGIRLSSPPNPQASLGLTYRGKSSQRSGVEAKRQINGKYDLSETHIANISVELDPHPDKTINSSASTPSLAHPNTFHLTHSMAEGTPIPDPEPTASIHGPDLISLTPPSPVRITSDPLGSPQLDLAPSPSPVPGTNIITFGPGISEAL